LESGISHGFSGTGTAQVSFGRRRRALHPPIPELLNICGERRRAWRLGLRLV
jgi:hypothetical protein